MKNSVAVLAIALALAWSCSSENNYKKAYDSINCNNLATYVSALASDEFMGRAPFTKGEEITINYLADQLETIGFEPAFNGSYFQKVPLVEIVSTINKPAVIKTKNRSFKFSSPDNVAITSPRVTDEIAITESEMVFAGFGITAPEYSWNDFEELDVEGKTIVVFVNDPGLYTENRDIFKGREMTYYGRWTYKFEEAARRGATGILIIHETEGAGYSYDIPKNSCITPNLFMQTKNRNSDRCLFTGWIEAESAKSLFSDLGYDIAKLRMEACDPGFTGFDMESTITVTINNSFEFNTSVNVAGVLRGTTRPEEVVIFSGHWDHFGIGEKQNGDSIYNGAVDNGTTMAMIFEIGEAFKQLDNAPDRSVMLFFPTAEEQGLLGSKYYTENPAFEIDKTVACINNDLVLPIGRMKDVMVTGFGQSELDDLLEEAAKKQGRYLYPDPNAHTGMYFRSDHFSFALKGIPSLYARGNCDSREFGKEWAAEMETDYIANKYHKAADNYYPEIWDLSGIVEDAQLSFEIGYKLVTSDLYPKWKEGSEFKNKR